MLWNKVIYCGLYKAVKTVHQATQHGPWYLWSMTRQKYLFSEHWHVTYTVTFPFTQCRRCFPNMWIQSGSTMWLCDELLTIVVLALVNRFVHGRVQTAVFRICVELDFPFTLEGIEIWNLLEIKGIFKFLQFETSYKKGSTFLVWTLLFDWTMFCGIVIKCLSKETT